MPAPNGEGDPTVRPLSTSELEKWVRMILDRHGLLHDEAKSRAIPAKQRC